MFYKIDNDETIARQYKVAGHSIQFPHNCDESNYMYSIIIYLNEA